jgi:hypothetical protein
VEHASNRDERGAAFAARLKVVPSDDGQLGERRAPVEFAALAIDRFLLLLQAALFDFVGAERFQVVG